MDFRDLGFDESMWVALHDMLEYSEETDRPHPPSRAYVRDNKAMKATPADIIEYPDSYHFVVDMPGLKSDQIKVQMEDNNVLVVSGERRREKEKDKGVTYIRMERRYGKFLKKFALFDNANRDNISAVYQDGVLTVAVDKLPPPEPKQPKTIEVKVGSPAAGSSGQGQVPLETQGQ